MTAGAEPLAAYRRYTRRKTLLVVVLAGALALGLAVALGTGATGIGWGRILAALSGFGAGEADRAHLIVWQIRLPQALAAVIAGAGLAVAGTVMQAVLRNPLGSPFTLGISHAAAFGAAVAVMLLSGTGTAPAGPATMSLVAFLGSLLATAVIMAVSRLRGASPQVMVLTGVAMGSLFTSGTMLLQYCADDVQLAAMVFWTFGDTARADWQDLLLLAITVGASCAYFFSQAWCYNALDAGEDTARALGVPVDRVRLLGMLVASLVTAVTIALLGIIGFVGLVAPHLLRGRLGGDHRFLLPACLFGGAILLLAADTTARLIWQPHQLPVSVLTALLGAPLFLCLIVKGRT